MPLEPRHPGGLEEVALGRVRPRVELDRRLEQRAPQVGSALPREKPAVGIDRVHQRLGDDDLVGGVAALLPGTPGPAPAPQKPPSGLPFVDRSPVGAWAKTSKVLPLAVEEGPRLVAMPSKSGGTSNVTWTMVEELLEQAALLDAARDGERKLVGPKLPERPGSRRGRYRPVVSPRSRRWRPKASRPTRTPRAGL